ncbi:hypothetical protein TEA_005754 [Camellia sinensis var. sinensis]|uniref:DEAD-box helicase OB fold domain-containing protein n=1 Tax=Camellia sinensis var. sinensis TaxID=542762 RepID=A0A4S4EPS9_CAMSN|nr:hypothetical protein TEA_005754 [Camellia sinensis var. sinensis]
MMHSGISLLTDPFEGSFSTGSSVRNVCSAMKASNISSSTISFFWLMPISSSVSLPLSIRALSNPAKLAFSLTFSLEWTIANCSLLQPTLLCKVGFRTIAIFSLIAAIVLRLDNLIGLVYKLDVVTAGKNFTMIRKAIAVGFLFHTQRKDPKEGYKTLVENQPVYFHPSSALFQR